MFAIIKTGGKQYVVKAGEIVRVEKLSQGLAGNKVVFDQVLLVADSPDKLTVGKPLVDGAKVEGSLIRNFKDKKIRVIKYKAKTRYKRVHGHRQQLAEVKIDKIIN